MFGHILRYNPLTINIFEDGINGHKGKGRQRKVYLEELYKMTVTDM